MSCRSNMARARLPLRLRLILARPRRACRAANLHEFPANWCGSGSCHTMAGARLLYQGEGGARGIITGFTETPLNKRNARMATAAERLLPLPRLSPAVSAWVDSVRELTQPRAVHWCEGTEAEAREITA